MGISRTLMFVPILLLFGKPSFGDTINFSGLDNPSVSYNVVPSYDVDGFTFTGTSSLGVWTTGDPGFFVAGVPDDPAGGTASVSLSEYYAGGTITMTQDNSQAFSISSIDVAQWGAYGSGFSGTYSATFEGFDSGDNLIATQVCSGADVDGQPVLAACNFSNFNDVSSMTVIEGTYAGGQAFQFTNVAIGGSATPEPGSLLLLCAGLSGIAIVRRRSLRRLTQK